jgi:hypothetical protein
MTDAIRNPRNRVDPPIGKFHAFWQGRAVFKNGRIKQFETEHDAWEYLARCDLAGRIIN